MNSRNRRPSKEEERAEKRASVHTGQQQAEGEQEDREDGGMGEERQ